MAITTTTSIAHRELSKPGGRVRVDGYITTSGTYATGGFAIAEILKSFSSLDAIVFTNADGYLFEWDKTNSKVIAYNATGGGTTSAGAAHTHTLSRTTNASGSIVSTVTYDASPGGNQVYLKFDKGAPYLCSNLANNAADTYVSFGSTVGFWLVHDASASTGGSAIYFDDDATQPSRLLADLSSVTSSNNVFLSISDYWYKIKITHDASASSNGTALYYDDATDERFESVNAGAADADIGTAYAIFTSANESTHTHTITAESGDEVANGATLAVSEIRFIAVGH